MESHPPEKIHWVCHLGENSSKNQRMKMYQFYVLEHQNTSYGDIEIVETKVFQRHDPTFSTRFQI